MPKPRRRPHQLSRPTAPRLRPDVAREFGGEWERLAWHALVWAGVLIEIPTQVHANERAARAPFEERIRNLREYWSHEPDAESAVHDALASWHRPSARISDDGRTATVYVESGEWPDQKTVAVDFALNGGGEMSIRCRNTPPDRPKLPTVLHGPYRDRTASEEAARLVRAAIALVSEPAPALPPPTPSRKM